MLSRHPGKKLRYSRKFTRVFGPVEEGEIGGRAIRVSVPKTDEETEQIRYKEVLRIDVPDEGIEEDELLEELILAGFPEENDVKLNLVGLNSEQLGQRVLRQIEGGWDPLRGRYLRDGESPTSRTPPKPEVVVDEKRTARRVEYEEDDEYEYEDEDEYDSGTQGLIARLLNDPELLQRVFKALMQLVSVAAPAIIEIIKEAEEGRQQIRFEYEQRILALHGQAAGQVVAAGMGQQQQQFDGFAGPPQYPQAPQQYPPPQQQYPQQYAPQQYPQMPPEPRNGFHGAPPLAPPPPRPQPVAPQPPQGGFGPPPGVSMPRPTFRPPVDEDDFDDFDDFDDDDFDGTEDYS